MITVSIQKERDGSLFAMCRVSGPVVEFVQDKARIEALPEEDREYLSWARNWLVRNPEAHVDEIPEIGKALEKQKHIYGIR